MLTYISVLKLTKKFSAFLFVCLKSHSLTHAQINVVFSKLFTLILNVCWENRKRHKFLFISNCILVFLLSLFLRFYWCVSFVLPVDFSFAFFVRLVKFDIPQEPKPKKKNYLIQFGLFTRVHITTASMIFLNSFIYTKNSRTKYRKAKNKIKQYTNPNLAFRHRVNLQYNNNNIVYNTGTC